LPTRALARKPYRRSSIDSSHEYIVAPAINELNILINQLLLFLFIGHNFWTRITRKLIKGSKDSDYSLVSNKNFSQNFSSSG